MTSVVAGGAIPPTTLYSINRAAGRSLTLQGPIDGTASPNTGIQQKVGSLGVVLNAARDGGFDITRDGRAMRRAVEPRDSADRPIPDRPRRPAGEPRCS